MTKTALFSVFIAMSAIVFAQETKNAFHPIVAWSNTVQQWDYLMGVDIGTTNNKRNFHSLLSFDFRPHSRKVQEFAGGNRFFQYQEKRYVITLGGRYLHELRESGKGVFIGLSGGYNFGEYRGLKLKPESGWILRPNGGLFWDVGPDLFTLQLGYEYFDSQSDTVTNHWLFLNFLFSINRNDY